ncbi:MAG TPA: T9SS type A sorting domain-containing protein [Saprospiraceae bacterium]|nr:T9SS type A sorting domain-containing protein [Saprospiraceae bacterium]
MNRMMSFLLLLAATLTSISLLAQAGTWHTYPIPSKVNDWMEWEGQLWAATDAGIFIINPSTGQVAEHLTKANAGLPSNSVEALTIDPQTLQPFIGTYDVALAFRSPDGQWQSIDYPAFIRNQAGGNMLLTYCMEFDNEGRLWAGTSVGLARYTDGEWTLFNQSAGLSFLGAVWSMAKTEDGAILAASNVMYKVPQGEETPQLFSPSPSGNNGFFLFAYGDAKAFTASNGDQWFFTDIGRAGRFHNGAWELYDPAQSVGVGHRKPQIINELPDGSLSIYYSDNLRFLRFHNGEWTLESTYTGALPIIGAYRSEDFDIILNSKEILIPGAQDTAMAALLNYPFESLPERFQTDHQKQLWTVTEDRRLLNLDSGAAIPCIFNGQSFAVGNFSFAPDGSIWATSGFHLYHYQLGQWTRYDHTNSLLPAQKLLTRITVDDLGRVWVYVYQDAIYRFDGSNWMRYPHPLFSNYYVYAMTGGANGDLWFSSYLNGQSLTVGRFNGADMQTFTQGVAGFDMDYALALAYDADYQRLWVTGNVEHAQYFDGSIWHTESFPLPAAGHQWIMRVHARDGFAAMSSSERVLLYAEGQWQEFNPTNSPLSGGAMHGLGLDAHNRLWISHWQPWALDIYETGLISSAVKPESSNGAIEMRVFPNPTAERAGLEISCREASTSAALRITDVDGRLVSTTSHSLQSGHNYLEVNVSRLSPGIYFMLLDTSSERFYGRMVKH